MGLGTRFFVGFSPPSVYKSHILNRQINRLYMSTVLLYEFTTVNQNFLLSLFNKICTVEVMFNLRTYYKFNNCCFFLNI